MMTQHDIILAISDIIVGLSDTIGIVVQPGKGVLCTAKKKGGGGGRKRAVSPQCEVRLKMATAEPA